MEDDKDRMGEKLRKKQKGEEERFFAEREAALIERLRRERAATSAVDARPHPLCPKDGSRLAVSEHHGVSVERCPTCHGLWLDAGQLQKIAERERDSWLGRLFFHPRDR